MLEEYELIWVSYTREEWDDAGELLERLMAVASEIKAISAELRTYQVPDDDG